MTEPIEDNPIGSTSVPCELNLPLKVKMDESLYISL